MSSKKKAPKKGPKPKPADQPPSSEAFFRPFAGLPKAAKPAPKGTDTKPADRKPAPPRPRPAPSPPNAAPPHHDHDDLVTFERLMAGVKPLDDRKGTRRVSASDAQVGSRLTPELAAERAAKEQALEEDARMRLHRLVEEGSRFEVVDDGRSIEGRRRGVDGGMVRRMRHGELPIDASLDLHGLRVDEARVAVESFVRDRRAKGDRVVLLVHGRGRNSPSGQPVLRGEVAAWLSEGKSSQHVAAFVTAPPEHGGEGAMCVLLGDHGFRKS